MGKNYATKDYVDEQIAAIHASLWGHEPALFDNDTGDIGRLDKRLQRIETLVAAFFIVAAIIKWGEPLLKKVTIE